MGKLYNSVSEEAISAAIDAIDKGGVVLMPADTVYGFFGRADIRTATDRVYALKERNRGKPFVIYTNKESVHKWAIVNDTAQTLINKFWPQALALVMQSTTEESDWFGSGTDSLALMPVSNNLVNSVIDGVSGPIFGTTVNKSGEPSIRTAQEAMRYLDGVDVMIADDSIPIYNVSSTMVNCLTNPPAIIREEAIPFEAIQKVLPNVTIDFSLRR